MKLFDTPDEELKNMAKTCKNSIEAGQNAFELQAVGEYEVAKKWWDLSTHWKNLNLPTTIVVNCTVG